MSKDIKERIRQMRETKETVVAYWAEMIPGVELPPAQLNGWAVRFDLDTMIAGLEAAVLQLSKSEANGGEADAVKVASSVMNRIHLENLPADERLKLKEKRHRIREVRSAAGKAGNEKRWKAEPGVATGCDDLRPSCDTLRTGFGNGNGDEYGSGLGAGNGLGHGPHQKPRVEQTSTPVITNINRNQTTPTPSGSLQTPPIPPPPWGGLVWMESDVPDLDDAYGNPNNTVKKLARYLYDAVGPAAQAAAQKYDWKKEWASDFVALVGEPADQVRAVIDFAKQGAWSKYIVRGKKFCHRYPEIRADWMKLARAKRKQVE
jgi:hypothetical protein